VGGEICVGYNYKDKVNAIDTIQGNIPLCCSTMNDFEVGDDVKQYLKDQIVDAKTSDRETVIRRKLKSLCVGQTKDGTPTYKLWDGHLCVGSVNV
jgi:hypothetical protein